jgi:8-oxo-dGTP diphosphatase
MERIQVVSAVIVRSGRVLLQQRDPLDRCGWAWETPGGKVEPGEAPEAALARELREELDVDSLAGGALGSLDFEPGVVPGVDKPWSTTFYRVARMSGTPRAREAVGPGWFLPEELPGLRMTPATGLFRATLADLARASGAEPYWPAGGNS